VRELLKKSSRLSIIEWLLIISLLTVTFFIFYYSDYSDTLDNGVMLRPSIVQTTVFFCMLFLQYGICLRSYFTSGRALII
jgi:heme/copper-type cytochrome/quinol oxidase subunit 3